MVAMMSNNEILQRRLAVKHGEDNIKARALPDDITGNLRYPLFDWQGEALQYFLQYQESTIKQNPTHLMFNMATGTGKTMLMGAMILYYYKQGYRKFLFFNNFKNIVGKTEDNFINKQHQKYIFTDKIIIDDKPITIKSVKQFSTFGQDIEIIFTTIQKLHGDIYKERENQATRGDLMKHDIVMLADEAHHFNTTTSKQDDMLVEQLDLTNNSRAEDIERSWERTINKILLQKDGAKNNKNVLLEFTATIPENAAVQEKYRDKTIYQFALKDFVLAGYTKNIDILSSSSEKKGRVLLALLFHWYRHVIAMKNNIANFKAVILFRSKTIEDSKKDYQDFLTWINQLSRRDFVFVKSLEKLFQRGNDLISQEEDGNSMLKKIIDELTMGNRWDEMIDFIKYNFAERNCIITNSETNKTKIEKTDGSQDKILNSLDDKKNHVRAIFTVQRLTEGWDVLNLFDIVRLYEGRDEQKPVKDNKNRKVGKTTIAEVQLIGRGVRYFPFAWQDSPRNKRKFDSDIGNETRILENFFYHSDNDHRYISELKNELKRTGLIQEKEKITFRLKESFKQDDFYNECKLWTNERVENKNRRQNDNYKTTPYQWRLPSVSFREDDIRIEKENDRVVTRSDQEVMSQKKFSDIIEDKQHIAYKAINKLQGTNHLAEFTKLAQRVKIEQMKDFLDSMGGKQITINGNPSSGWHWLKFFTDFFAKVFAEIKQYDAPHVGTEFKAVSFSDIFGDAKEKVYINDGYNTDVVNKGWYILEAVRNNLPSTRTFFGTDEEIKFVEYVGNHFSNIDKKYEKKFLLRNEEQYKIFDFDTGQGFCPDFLLLLKDDNFYYQCLVEAKGPHLVEHDEWKNVFLNKILEKYGDKNQLSFSDDKYKIIGLPMYNNQRSLMDYFDKKFKGIILQE